MLERRKARTGSSNSSSRSSSSSSSSISRRRRRDSRRRRESSSSSSNSSRYCNMVSTLALINIHQQEHVCIVREIILVKRKAIGNNTEQKRIGNENEKKIWFPKEKKNLIA